MDYQVSRLLHSVHKTRIPRSKSGFGFKYFGGYGWIDGTWVPDLK